jgi:hypothetical protein
MPAQASAFAIALVTLLCALPAHGQDKLQIGSGDKLGRTVEKEARKDSAPPSS